VVQVSTARYRMITVAALVALIGIVVTGAAVRLTGSGLGCDDWPNCNAERLIDVSSTHAAIEQVNRLFTGLVSVAVSAAVLGSLARTPRRRDLTMLSFGLVAGVVGQIVLGGITVLVDLHPVAVQGHFLLSMVLVANATVLVHRAAEPDGGPRVAAVSPEIGRHVTVIAAMTAVALVTGTVVTGAGPHAGDEEARRFAVAIQDTARVHSTSVLVVVALVVALVVRLRRRPAERLVLAGGLSTWIFIALLQAVIGYVQYFSDVPAMLVGAHVLGATVLWCTTVSVALRSRPARMSSVVRAGDLQYAADDPGDPPFPTDPARGRRVRAARR
jgi:cytochrome c oxidase assembly protein subunit 15